MCWGGCLCAGVGEHMSACMSICMCMCTQDRDKYKKERQKRQREKNMFICICMSVCQIFKVIHSNAFQSFSFPREKIFCSWNITWCYPFLALLNWNSHVSKTLHCVIKKNNNNKVRVIAGKFYFLVDRPYILKAQMFLK